MTTIRHYTGLNRTPALPLAVKAWVDLIQQGHCGNTVQVAADHNAVVAFVHDEPVGLITYTVYADYKEIGIWLGYIEPAHRGHGLYSRLWDALVAQAKALGLVQISSTTYLQNSAMRAVAAQQGRVETNVTLEYPIP